MTQQVQDWFGDDFYELHPLLQQIHLNGGHLSGDVVVSFGSGLGGLVGKRLAAKLGVPTQAGKHCIDVNISHDEQGLHWGRCFNQGREFISLFEPVGKKAEAGYWVERSGALAMTFTVEVKEGGWYWHCTSTRLGKLKLPLFLLPKSDSYKCIENERYVFNVSFSLPILGKLLTYSGGLELQ